jgi:hypothetical protein
MTSRGQRNAQTIQKENYTEQVKYQINRAGLHANSILKGLVVDTKPQGTVQTLDGLAERTALCEAHISVC